MNTATDMVAYHGDQTLKDRTLNQIAEHQRLNQIVQGTYWQKKGGEYRGCAVGCLLHDPEGGHRRHQRHHR